MTEKRGIFSCLKIVRIRSRGNNLRYSNGEPKISNPKSRLTPCKMDTSSKLSEINYLILRSLHARDSHQQRLPPKGLATALTWHVVAWTMHANEDTHLESLNGVEGFMIIVPLQGLVSAIAWYLTIKTRYSQGSIKSNVSNTIVVVHLSSFVVLLWAKIKINCLFSDRFLTSRESSVAMKPHLFHLTPTEMLWRVIEKQ
jgi:hypothetical protein